MYSRWILYFLAFVSGGAIMVLELIASRILSPYAGSTIYTWTNIIGLILGSIAAGYYFGGKLADKKPYSDNLRYLLLFSSLSILAIGLLTDELLYTLSEQVKNVHIFSFISVILFFSIPSALLAAVYPYIIKFSTLSLKKTGSTTGRIYALSTLGSIAGTYLTGYVLIPMLGSRMILILLSFTLFVCFIISKNGKKKHAVVSILTAVAMISFAFYQVKVLNRNRNSHVIVDTETQYSRVWIAEGVDTSNSNQAPVRHLANDIYSFQGSMYINNPIELVSEYSKYYRISEHFLPGIKSALMIGGGTYAYPKYFLQQHPDARMDIVEIDPQITTLAEQYFHLNKNERLSIYHEDGRVFLNKNKKKYDAIFIDALFSFTPPFQLTTTEAIGHMKEGLSQNGIIIVNILASLQGQNSKILEAQRITYAQHFNHIYLFATRKNSPTELQNVILVVQNSSESIPLVSNNSELNTILQNIWISEEQFTLAPLTDDFAPVDKYTVTLLYR